MAFTSCLPFHYSFLLFSSTLCALILPLSLFWALLLHDTLWTLLYPFILVKFYPSLRCQLPPRSFWILKSCQIPSCMPSYCECCEPSWPSACFNLWSHTFPGIGRVTPPLASQAHRRHSVNRELMNASILFLVGGLYLRLSLPPSGTKSFWKIPAGYFFLVSLCLSNLLV